MKTPVEKSQVDYRWKQQWLDECLAFISYLALAFATNYADTYNNL